MKKLPAVVIRTSDRATFKRCRRKWSLSSALQRNRTQAQSPSYFWFGTVGHFALEDYHGHRYYGTPIEAAKAALAAMKKAMKATIKERVPFELPDDYEEQFELLCAVLQHYLVWSARRNFYETYWYNGHPQLELRARIPLPIDKVKLQLWGYSEAFYEVTLDRVVRDLEDGNLWVQDYKFFKAFSTEYLDYDQQASAYIWGASCLYPEPIEGFVHMQLRKVAPVLPERTSKGVITTNMQVLNGRTTFDLYQTAIIDAYGSVDNSPPQYARVLAELAQNETDTGDSFIKMIKTTRNAAQIANTGTKILLETTDMLSPKIALYPNETRDCHWECEFRDVCLMIDSNEDWESVLEATTVSRSAENFSWRKFLS